MIVEFRLPDLGEGMEDAEVVSWLVADGDAISKDQPFVEIQTDKAVIEIPSPVEGTVLRLGAPVGAIVAVGQVLISFESSGDETPRPVEAAPRASAPAGGPLPGVGAAGDAAPTHVKAAPSVRRLAQELGVELGSILGSGEGGRVVATDVELAASMAQRDGEKPSGPIGSGPNHRTPADSSFFVDQRIALSGIRRRTAQIMTDAWTSIPHVTGMDEVDATALLAARAAVQDARGGEGAPITLLSFFVKAVCLALRHHPMVNARLDMDAAEIVQLGHCNIGIAAATPTGLVVPVIRDADRCSMRQLADEIARLTAAARSAKLTLDDLRGGTFTITNFGALGGGRFATPIIRPPEVAIMGFGAIKDRPLAIDGRVVVRPTLPYSISVDHRLIDGQLSGEFSRYVMGLLTDPAKMMLDS